MKTIDITPDFDALFRTFKGDARIQSETFADRLNPATRDTVEDWQDQKLEILRITQGLLASLSICGQCTTRLEMVLDLREILDAAVVAIRTQADELEREINGREE